MNTVRSTRRNRALLALTTSALLAIGGLLAPVAASAASAESTVSGATLDWGVKSSFRGYVTSPIAHGSIQTLGSTTGTFRWPGGSGTASSDGGSASISFGTQDGVRFTGHEMNGVYALDLSFTHPRVVFTSASSARLVLDVAGREFKSMDAAGEMFTKKDVDFATVSLPAATASGSQRTWANAPVTLTAAGAEAFGGFYSAGTALDPLTLTATLQDKPQAAATTTTLTASAPKILEGEGVELSAVITPAMVPGSVVFSDGETVLGTVGVSGDTARHNAMGLAVGTHSITARFVPQDTAAHQPSTSAAVTVTVAPGTDQPGEWKPSLSVFLADGVTPAAGKPVHVGDTLIVKGSGYDPEANVGGRGVPVPADLPQGNYVVFGSFGADWKPSADAPSSARKVATQGWALTEATLERIPEKYRETVRAQWIPLAEDGTFTWTTSVKAVDVPVEGGSYGVYTYAAGGQKNAAQELGVAVDFRGERPVEPSADPVLEIGSGANATPRPGDVVTFTVKNLEAGEKVRFEVHSDPIDAGTASAGADGAARLLWSVPAGFVAGQHEVRVYRVIDGVSEKTPFLTKAMTTAAAPVVVPPVTEDPKTPVCVAHAVDGGSMTWGLKQSFRSYVEGPIAKGEFSGGSFTASGGSLNVESGARGTVRFGGSITATGHNGLLNFRLSNPSVVLNGGGSAALYAQVSSTDTSGKPSTNGTVHFADLSFGAASVSGGSVSVNGATVRLTAAGATAFAGFYEAGTVLDPMSFRVSLGADTACDSTTDPSGGGSLATTGADGPVLPLAMGAILLIAGLALVAVRRRLV